MAKISLKMTLNHNKPKIFFRAEAFGSHWAMSTDKKPCLKGKLKDFFLTVSYPCSLISVKNNYVRHVGDWNNGGCFLVFRSENNVTLLSPFLNVMIAYWTRKPWRWINDVRFFFNPESCHASSTKHKSGKSLANIVAITHTYVNR